MSTMRPLILRTLCTKLRPSRSRDQVLISPHPVSNLNLIKLAIPKDETPSEREYRIKFDALQEWNQKYWEEQNTGFLQEKRKFMKDEMERRKKGRNGDLGGGSAKDGTLGGDSAKDGTLSYEELSIFYKKFLEERQAKHVKYSWEWYCRHVSLLVPAVKAISSRFIRNLRGG